MDGMDDAIATCIGCFGANKERIGYDLNRKADFPPDPAPWSAL